MIGLLLLPLDKDSGEYNGSDFLQSVLSEILIKDSVADIRGPRAI